MAGAPISLTFNRVAGLVALVVLGTGLWFVLEQLASPARSTAWFYVGAVFLALGLFGRFPMLRFFREGEASAPAPKGRVDALTGAGGARLHVELHGPTYGPTLVLTHDWGADRTVWEPLVAALAGRRRVIVWDLPGHGGSDRPFDEVYTIKRAAEDLHAVLQLAEGPAVLVGHGAGGLAALELLRRRPHVAGAPVAAVAVIGAAGRTGEGSAFATLERGLRKPLIEPLLRLDVFLSPLAAASNWAGYMSGLSHLAAVATVLGVDPNRRSVDRTARAAARCSPSVAARAVRAALDVSVEPALDDLPVPLLVVAGGDDRLTDPQAAEAAAARAPQGRFLRVEGAGHAVTADHAGALAAAVSDFAETVFDRTERMARSHAEVLRHRPGYLDFEAPHAEPKSWDLDGEVPAEPVGARRSDPVGQPIGRA